jgi:hypothetical protein
VRKVSQLKSFQEKILRVKETKSTMNLSKIKDIKVKGKSKEVKRVREVRAYKKVQESIKVTINRRSVHQVNGENPTQMKRVESLIRK